MSSNTYQFAQGFVKHEGVQQGWVPRLCWVIRLYSEWVGGVCKVGSEWEGDLGCLDFDGVPVEVPNALA